MAGASSVTLTEADSVFGRPTFRYGEICKIIDGLNPKKAKSLGALIETKWKDIIDDAIENPLKCGFKEIITRKDSTMFEQFAEGPIFVLPEFNATISDGERDFSSIVRPSITVCFKPHHSKIWVRVLDDSNNLLLLGNSDALVSFFEAAEKVCRKLAGLLKTEIYKVSLELIGLKANVEAIHKICIKVILAPRSDERSKLEIPNDAKEFGAGRVRGSALGSCFKYKIGDVTNITCFLNGVKGDYDLASYPNEFSKTLVELIALRI